MKKFFSNVLAIMCLAAMSASCEKELKNDEPKDPDFYQEDVASTLAQEEKCYVKGVIYHGYIKCLDPGETCEVKCEEDDKTPADVVIFFNSLSAVDDNTEKIKSFFATLAYIPQHIQQTIQSASKLHYHISTDNGATAYAIIDGNENLLYAFAH